jgi:hypothetical protein
MKAPWLKEAGAYAGEFLYVIGGVTLICLVIRIFGTVCP